MCQVKKYSSNKDINKTIRELLRENWQVVKTRKCIKIKSPDCKVQFVASCTPSNRKAVMHFMIDLNRAQEQYELAKS